MNTTRLIEAYLDGSLEKDKADEIKARADNDVEFAELIRLHKEINESIRDDELDGLRRSLRKLTAKHSISRTRELFPLYKLVQIAAGLLFIILLGTVAIRWFFPGNSSEAIFEKYYVKYEPDVITRSGNMFKSSLENAQFQYQVGNYTEGARLLVELVSYDTQNYMAWYYLGLANIELHQPDEAINDFSKISPDWNNPHLIHRNWYLALCFIKTGQEKQAIPLLKSLSAGDGYYAERAGKILSRIRP